MYLESFEMWCWIRIEKIKWSEKVTNEGVLERKVERRTLLNNILRRRVNWIAFFKFHWRTDDGSERNRRKKKKKKKKNTVPWWFEKQKKIFGAKGGSWRSKKMETIVYQSSIRKKYKLSMYLDLQISSILNNSNNYECSADWRNPSHPIIPYY